MSVTEQPQRRSSIKTLKSALYSLSQRLRWGNETRRASAYWGNLPDYHLTNDDDPTGIVRSQWVAELISGLEVSSVLEVGTNSGRNLQYIKEAQPSVRLRGIDVNPRAVEFAVRKGLDIDFSVADANVWQEGANAWDVILTMSVLDHVPDAAIDELAMNIVVTAAKYIVAVELWDGAPGERGPYKYSRDTRALFESHGVRTLLWEPSVGQYDVVNSFLWAYIGAVGEPGDR
jgi:SAM-dependent methyltransferase